MNKLKRFFNIQIPMGTILLYVIVFNTIVNVSTNGMTMFNSISSSFSFGLGIFVAFFGLFAIGEYFGIKKWKEES